MVPGGRFLILGAGVHDALAEIEGIAAEFPPGEVPGARMFRRGLNRLAGTAPPLHEVQNLVISRRLGGLALRLYRPAPGRLPAALFLHGGGFHAGDLESHDTLARSLAQAAGCVVVGVHYRRAPEHPCPAAPDDCLTAAQWLVEHADELDIDPQALAVVGDGAGGALAAITARRVRDSGGFGFCHQVLLYPVISRARDTASWHELADAPLVSAERADLAWSMYVPQGSEVSPALVVPEGGDLAGLPPTLVITAEYDPLRDEAEAFGEALHQAGVPTVVHRYPGMIHGFAGLAGVIPAGRDVIDEVAASLRASFPPR